MTNAETKLCQSCQATFTIAPEDLAFYEKMAVPAPTWCPKCRLIRRMTFRNERSLYVRQCSGTSKPIVSVYDESVSFPVYSNEYWYGDAWDGTVYGREYDFTRTFFEQFTELSKVAPRIYMWQVNAVDSDYSNYIVNSTNCYLCFTALGGNEECMYSGYITDSIQCVDSDHLTKCELCYECLNCDSCYNCRYSVDAMNCRDSWFLRACQSCSDCFGCVNLTNKQYCIFNTQYTKEEYEQKLAEFDLKSTEGLRQLSERTDQLWQQCPRRSMRGTHNERMTGDYNSHASDTKNAWFSNDCEGCQNVYFVKNAKDSQDVTVAVLGNEWLYECHAIPKQGSHLKFSELCSNSCRDLEYCSNCNASTNLFGCIGLNKKQYCILNKQYTKEEYEALLPRIKQHMNDMPYTDAAGRVYRYGEFFPSELSPFAYNESVAQEFFPLTEPTAQRFRWKPDRINNQSATMRPDELPEHITDETSSTLLQAVIACQHQRSCNDRCSLNYKLQPAELAFLAKHNLPLPRLCPNCRHAARTRYRNPIELHQRQCQCNGAQSSNGAYTNLSSGHTSHVAGQACPNQFETSFAPNRPEIVYCEDCYTNEVV